MRHRLAHHRAALAQERDARACTSRMDARSAGIVPAQTAAARARRGKSFIAAEAADAEWAATSRTSRVTEGEMGEPLLPGLRSLPLSTSQRSTGLFVAAYSKSRSGKLLPHPRHWESLSF
jgi:hypothetical protein